MSNQISLMLSFVFLAFFIILSGEVISYEIESSIAISNTNLIALDVQKYGANNNSLSNDYFDDINIDIEESDLYTTYLIKTTKKHDSFSNLFPFFKSDIVYEISVSRKE